MWLPRHLKQSPSWSEVAFDRKINCKKCRQDRCEVKQHHQCWLRNSDKLRFFFLIMEKNLYTKACNGKDGYFTDGVKQTRPENDRSNSVGNISEL